MTSRKLNSALFGGVCRDPRAIQLFTPKEDPSEIVDDPLQTLIEKRKELLKDKNNWMTYGDMSKIGKNFNRMSGYKNDGAHTLFGGGLRVIYEPPLRDSYSDVVSPVIKLSSLALEDYNKREGTNYKYVGLLKAYVWCFPPKSHTFEITFTASEALQSDFEDVSFQTKVCYSTHGRVACSCC